MVGKLEKDGKGEVDDGSLYVHELIWKLYISLKEKEYKEVHFTAESIFGDETITSVISVYRGLKPANIVLTEILKYVEENGSIGVREIREIEEDMSWKDSDTI